MCVVELVWMEPSTNDPVVAERQLSAMGVGS